MTIQGDSKLHEQTDWAVTEASSHIGKMCCAESVCAATSFSACNFLSRCILLLLTLNIDVKDYFFVLLKQTVHDIVFYHLCFGTN